MPAVNHSPLSAHPHLGRALRWARHRARLTQRDVRERVLAQGATVSLVYLQKIEAGQKRPSPTMLAHLLTALGVSGEDLAALCEEPAVPEPGRWRPSSTDPHRPTTWSDPVSASSSNRPPLRAATPAVDPLWAELVGIWPVLTPQMRQHLLDEARRSLG